MDGGSAVIKKLTFIISIVVFTISLRVYVIAAEQPVAIFHAFDQHYLDVERFVCDLPSQGFSHVQIAPAQKSNPSEQWWARYQPVDYRVIEGKGSEQDLKKLLDRAHGCGVKVIADVVFNHMANMPEYADLNFPGISSGNFHSACGINYGDGNRTTEMYCRLGDLPDLDHTKPVVRDVQKDHIKKLLGLGIDGFRFDAAKHMPPDMVKQYIDFIDGESKGKSWNYLEVIEDGDTKAEDYNRIAAVTDFILYRSMKRAFSFGGDLRTLRVPEAIDDPRSVTFGRNHDTILRLNSHAIDPYDNTTDAYLATAYVLAREGGTPLIFNWDNYDNAFIRYGVTFRRIMRQRGDAGGNVRENVLAAVDSPTVLMMERGSEGFFIVNKGTETYDIPSLDLTLTSLEGCYRELRNNFNVAVERRDNGKKYVTMWGTWDRGGMEVKGRDALYFIREPWSQCQAR
jgi:alpha-amylase